MAQGGGGMMEVIEVMDRVRGRKDDRSRQVTRSVTGAAHLP